MSVLISGRLELSFSPEELFMLREVLECTLRDIVSEGDDPSEVFLQVRNKVITLAEMSKTRGQGVILDGGDFGGDAEKWSALEAAAAAKIQPPAP